MKIFVSGGCKNGKSYFAQRLSKMPQTEQLYYVATMASVDDEDDERIARHKLEREGWGYITIEQPTCIENILLQCDPDGSYLLDSVTALLANEMFSSGASDSGPDAMAAKRIIGGLEQILSTVEHIVIVSDYIYSDAMIYDELTELYRKSLAQIDRAAAKACDVVLEVAYSAVIVHRAPLGLELPIFND